MGRPREHDEATRERLLEAAERVSANDGWEAVTVRRVAEEAGTSTRAVYALFGSKEGLEQALHEAMFLRLRDLFQRRERSEDPRTDALELALAYRLWATERPQRYAIAIHRFLGPGAGPRSDAGLAVARGALEELRQAVIRCHDAGLMPGRDVEEVIVQMRTVAHGLAEFENLELLGEDPRSQWLTVVGALLDGLAKPPEAAAAPVPAAAS
jgi:AcrR family transcriptional regulator